MPFDDRTFPSSEAAAFRRNRRRVALWLFGVATMVYGMVVLGGATRLTGSGLSIMEWAPLSGALPPLSDAEWNRLFGLYRQIPQYAVLHPGMDVAGFKGIFWLEYCHRLLGRLVGAAFLLPMIFFAATGALERRMMPRLLGLFALGGLQGAVGWFMVASGFFPDSTAVSPYRLVIHLSLALTLYAALIWTGLTTLNPISPAIAGADKIRTYARACAVLVALTIVAGGFTAGLHAGLIYNSFPLMDGRLVPAGYADLSPPWRNLTENIAAVQFNHRLLASLSLITVITTVVAGLRARLTGAARAAILALAAAVAVQYALGIATLLTVVAVPLAVLHQGCAVVLLTASLVLLHNLRGATA